MARSWAELLGEADAAPEPETRGGGMFARLRDSLSKSRRALAEQIAVATFDPGESASWERLEEALIAADVGVPATAELVQRLEAREDAADLGTALQEEIARIQNGLQQARLFGRAVDVSGIVLTKLDGSAKGGIEIAIAHELGLPVKLIGIGERLDDLRPFDAVDFARALVSAK